MKVGILIVAYNATSTLVSVLKRIPEQVWDEVDEVVVFDDASEDHTFEIAVGYQHLSKRAELKVFRNEQNLGYGGNQKNGYEYLIANGIDVVVLLHGDGQYAPEHLERMYRPILEGKSDAVFGSRFMPDYGGPLKGGMPYYKYIGNRILTAYENRELGMSLTEFHSGYRAYSLSALSTIDLSDMTDDFHFDTEIIIKLHHQGFRITEIPIPTYYGKELCYVDGFRYAKDVAKAIRRYKNTVSANHSFPEFKEYFPHYPLKKGRYSSHYWLKILCGKDNRILDIGCGEGDFADSISRDNIVTGVDCLPAPRNSTAFKEYFSADLEQGLATVAGITDGPGYDRILLLDVLEHIRFPERLLEDCRPALSSRGRLLVSLPNVANITVRISLLFGRWRYADRGILDKTHYKFFTRNTGRELLENCGFRVLKIRMTVMPVDIVLGLDSDGRISRFVFGTLNIITRLMPGLFGYQTIYEAVVPQPVDE